LGERLGFRSEFRCREEETISTIDTELTSVKDMKLRAAILSAAKRSPTHLGDPGSCRREVWRRPAVR
jgi:hypothetical protein